MEPQIEQGRPKMTRRKSSFGDTLSKIARGSFNRRRTNTIPLSTSTNTLGPTSHVPISTTLPRSTSLLSSMSNQQTTSKVPQPTDNTTYPKSPELRASRRTSHRFRKSSIIDRPPPIQESPYSHRKRNSDAQIPQHTLLKTVQPPMPKSQTYGDLSCTVGRLPPRFMRPTSSSAARQNGRMTKLQKVDGPPKIVEVKRTQKTSMSSSFTEYLNDSSSLQTDLADAMEENSLPTSYRRPSNAVSSHPSDLSPLPDPKRRSHLFSKPWKRLSNIGAAVTKDEADHDPDPPRIDMDFNFADDAASTSSKSTIRSTPISWKIYSPQPAPYWLGRVTALSDRFRTEALEAQLDPQSPSSSSTSFSSSRSLSTSSMHNNAFRLARVWLHLQEMCVTREAMMSLDEFKEIYEARWTEAGERRPCGKEKGRWRWEKLGLGRR